ncbi:putative RNase H-like nuclease [Bradyrhizobium sp. USDA 4369]
MFLGLDGFRNGWVAVRIDGERRAIEFCPDVAGALAAPFVRAAIDIPIGMSDDGARACDLLARNRLAPHRSRVFTGARRWLWEDYTDPDQANAEASRRGQARASRQLWHLGRKIMEVDAFVRGHRELDIREAHPELVFLRLYGAPLPAKKTDEGARLRRDLLFADGFHDIDEWVSRARIGTGAKADDVLDACAVALAARDCAGCVPEGDPTCDAHGLPMQIWF